MQFMLGQIPSTSKSDSACTQTNQMQALKIHYLRTTISLDLLEQRVPRNIMQVVKLYSISSILYYFTYHQSNNLRYGRRFHDEICIQIKLWQDLVSLHILTCQVAPD